MIGQNGSLMFRFGSLFIIYLVMGVWPLMTIWNLKGFEDPNDIVSNFIRS